MPNRFIVTILNNKDIRLEILQKLEVNPNCTQRELSREMGVSIGKVNYCLKKLIEKGLVKIMNFAKNPNKKGYSYLLTQNGIEEKSLLTYKFLKIKMAEYEALKEEIANLQKDAENINIK